MVYHKKKGFASQPVELEIIPCTFEGTLQPSQPRFTPLVFTCQRTPFSTLLHFQRMCLESGIKDEGIGDHQGASQRFLFVPLGRTAPPSPFVAVDLLTIVEHPNQEGDMCSD